MLLPMARPLSWGGKSFVVSLKSDSILPIDALSEFNTIDRMAWGSARDGERPACACAAPLDAAASAARPRLTWVAQAFVTTWVAKKRSVSFA